jgi:hypothetical protein
MFAMARKCISAVGAEIHQTKAFATLEEELLVSLLRTTDVLRERFEQALEPFQISMKQYNVLRILRGAEPKRPAHPANRNRRGCGHTPSQIATNFPHSYRTILKCCGA